MTKFLIALASLTSILFYPGLGAAQNNNSTLIVYASTYIPFDSSFSTPQEPLSALAKFPSGFKRTNKMRLDSHQTVCARQDNNGDGDTGDSGEQIKEKFHEAYYMGFVINNYSSEDITIDYMRYETVTKTGRTIRSTKITPTHPVVVKAGQDASALFRFTELRTGGRRSFIGWSTPISRGGSRHSISFTIVGHSRKRQNITLSHNEVVRFSDINNCQR